jgi:hypothetical protein
MDAMQISKTRDEIYLRFDQLNGHQDSFQRSGAGNPERIVASLFFAPIEAGQEGQSSLRGGGSVWGKLHGRPRVGGFDLNDC